MNVSTSFNTSNATGNRWYTTPVDDFGTALSAAILAPLFVFGVFANILTIVVILRSRKLKSPFNTIIVSLCFSDLISALLSVLYVYRRTWGVDNWADVLPVFLCKLSWGGDIATSISTSLHILTFAFLRFFSLKWPYNFKAIKIRHATIIILIIWVISIGCGFVPLALWSVVKHVRLAQHLIHDKSKTWNICSLGRPWYGQFKDYTLSGYVIFFYIPLILVCLFSVGVGAVFCSRRLKKMKNSTDNIVTVHQHAVEASRKRKENQALLQLALIVGSFMLGYLPQSVYYIYVSVRGTPTQKNLVYGWWFSMIAYMLLRLSECLNPIFYNLGSSQIREETMAVFRKICCCRTASSGDLPKVAQLTAITKAPSIKKLNQVAMGSDNTLNLSH